MKHVNTETVNMLDKIIDSYKKSVDISLSEIITKYDFLVGSIECKHRLMQLLPDDAKIICSPYIEESDAVYAIKKFYLTDLIN